MIGMPEKVNTFRPPDIEGRGVTIRVAADASSGNTWYFLNSSNIILCIFLTLSGWSAATSVNCDQSCSISNSSNL